MSAAFAVDDEWSFAGVAGVAGVSSFPTVGSVWDWNWGDGG